ncbi:MAG: hypothetical protein D6710_01855 [Nitrospirae bacterium]|nr:MAG: hypothetical protein D6710_01855 [Nitrospirota bacterium]
MNLLSKISRLISAGHKEAIKIVYETIKKKSLAQTSRELEFEAKRLARRVAGAGNRKVLEPKLAKPGSKISSEDHNDNMEAAFIDLNALYKDTGSLGNIQSQQRASIIDAFSKARAAILKLINDARTFAIRSANPEFDDVKVINFNIANNRAKSSPAALVDPETRLLKLPEIGKRRAHLRRRGLRSSVISVEVIAQGRQGKLSTQFKPENAVDAKQESFWAEVIYTDAVYENKYSRWSPNPDGSMVDTIKGPIIKFKIDFGGSEAINQIKILPFSNFPVKVLEITYAPSASSALRKPIPNFIKEESLDWMEFNFEAVFASDIEIVFAQESYRTFIVDVPKNLLYSSDFMSRFFSTRLEEFSQNIPNLEDIRVGGNHNIYSEALQDLDTIADFYELEKLPSTEIDLAGKSILSIGESLARFDPSLKPLIEEISSYTDQNPIKNDDIVTLKKFEYVIGAREIETNFVIYSPIGFYESDKLQPAATITNIQIEVDERHPEFRSSTGPVKQTSTEWSIELAEDREVPIFPANHADENGLLPVKGELLDIDPDTNVGYSRLQSQLSYVLVREDGEMLASDEDYDVVWDDTTNGRLKITINSDRFHRNKTYTIDYFAAQSAASIDVLSNFKDKRIPAPESFSGTGPENDISLKYFPYVDYSIINSDDFEFSDTHSAYEYTAPQDPYDVGLARFYPLWVDSSGSVISGATGQQYIVSGIPGVGNTSGTPDWTSIDQSYLSEPHAYYIKISALPGHIYKVTSIDSSTQLTLEEIPSIYTGVIGENIPESQFSGNILTGTTPPLSGFITVPYSLEVVYEAGDTTYGFDNVLYEPIEVSVGGIKAKNITSYTDLEQPAFTISPSNDGEYEFIHDGKKLYFNQAINSAEILVNYRWMTKYAKVKCTLRTTKLVSPTITPQVNEVRLLLNTTII